MKTIYRLSVSGLVALACLSSVQADFTINRMDTNQIQTPRFQAPASTSSIYIVQMRDEPAVAYKGGLAGFVGTKPAKGGKLQPTSKNVQDYVAHLDATHNRVASSVNTRKVYSYRYGFNGFAASMTASDAAKLQKRGDVVRLWKDEIQKIQTNTSPNYIGVSENGQAWARGVKGENVVIGVIDTGIWPEHPSFADNDGSGNPSDSSWPWQGHYNISTAYSPLEGFESSGCSFGNTAANPDDAAFSCNDKLLTARCYNVGFSNGPDPSNPCGGDGANTGNLEFQSARDYNGHGSHTASTAGGNNRVAASINGRDLGTISGIAPRARIAVYKVCWEGPDPGDDGCADSDSIAAIDQAIADGVDVINYSIGGPSTQFGGADNIGFFFAEDAGIFVAVANGNAGPNPQTTGTPAGVPWVTSVGATQDDGVSIGGLKIIQPHDLAAIYAAYETVGGVSFADSGDISALLVPGNPIDGCTELTNAAAISGNIVLIKRGDCTFLTKYNTAAAAGARAIVMYNNVGGPIRLLVPGAPIPGLTISQTDGEMLAAYQGEDPMYAEAGRNYNTNMGNRIASFSSRGPNGGALDIIKPDVSAPGVSILAAVSPASSGGELFANYGGTSMASPHVAGAFALIKQIHPDWTPAMARSALMTTGRQGLQSSFGDGIATPFDIGAGEILPTSALYPGLTYNTGFYDYAAFTCANNTQYPTDAECDWLRSVGYSDDASELNLPSIAISQLFGSKTVSRTFTNVGNSSKLYTVSVDAPAGIEVSVSPESVWLAKGQSATYEVTFSTKPDHDFEWSYGSLTWSESSGTKVRSPIAIRSPAIDTPVEVDSVASAEGGGSVDIPVEMAYTGEYMAAMSGLQAGFSAPATLSGPGSIQVFCVDLPANVHTRISTFDVETSAPGENDLDIQAFLLNDDCANATDWVTYLGGSFSFGSDEVIDVPNGPAGAYYIEAYYYSAPNDEPIDFIGWIQPVFADNGNTTVTAPSEAINGSSETVTVDYESLSTGRYLGVLQHEDADGNIGNTIVDVDATGVVVPDETP